MRSERSSVLLLRHGQSEWNALRRWQGSADVPLSELGRTQARNTGDRLASIGLRFAGIWASDLVRATETATIIAERLRQVDGVGHTTVTTDARLREADAGEWQGMTPDQIERRYPGWLESHRRPASFEPYDQVVDRAAAALAAVAASLPPGRQGLVVSHSGLIRSLIRSRGIPDSRIPNLGGVWMTTAPRSVSQTGRVDGTHLSVGDMFDPKGIEISGVDAPGEDPGEQPHEPGGDHPTRR